MSKIDIEKLKNEIMERLKPLNPDKIILFGSYAYGEPNEESDIDLFIIKDALEKEKLRDEMLQAQILLWDIVEKYKIGSDVFVDCKSRIKHRMENIRDQFYKKIIKKGRMIYVK
ncbi:nucleotidyltransferase domain-containing protein [Nitratiruptor tergarcus]|uniref:UTP:GlnB (Protein PII) uridylyltransferase n=1 Tax=Nitratiruptor tergarcus DSM 16512 TaxID=1069081 RepID=A0A1W1WT66_9BACT|nr:nucleotidyltransferase domain-containing protein [Nitratiruptor tergarcus]SMC09487.1 UTP:GlnB (protein PII) uridylyltransferase [Nitratiruptor tergarcus DSM 16512]